jgi:membrane protein required for colicin V production
VIIDIIVLAILILAIIKGFQDGLIVAVFSMVAFVIGLAAAMKLSVVVAGYIDNAIKISNHWLPVISFAVVFFIVVMLVRWGARLIQKTVQLAMLGWANRIGGIILYAILYILIFSVILFYAEQLQLIKSEEQSDSKTFTFIRSLAPMVLEGLGKIIPLFKGMFQELEGFFENVSRQIPPAG